MEPALLTHVMTTEILCVWCLRGEANPDTPKATLKWVALTRFKEFLDLLPRNLQRPDLKDRVASTYPIH
jgi:hypothetical protein